MPAKKETGFELLKEEIAKLLNLTKDKLPTSIQDIIQSLIYQNNRYGLIWEEKTSRESFDNNIKDGFIPYLKEIESKNIVSNSLLSTNNLLIEGDNYHALKTLQATHKRKIDFIYIDPPYNTGNKDFKYNDTYVDKEDNFRHSKWLAFMEKRLSLAKELLSDDGIIFISIDDNEQAQLKLLCDEIFDNKFLGTIIQNKSNSQNDALHIQKNHEYIHCYAKNISSDKKLIIDKEKKETMVLRDEIGFYVKTGLSMGGGEEGTLNSRPNLGYTFYYNESTNDIIPLLDYDINNAKKINSYETLYKNNIELLNKGYVAIRPPRNGLKIGRWKWSLEKTIDNLHRIIITKTKNSFSVYKKDYKDGEIYEKNKKTFLIEDNSRPAKSILNISNSSGTDELKELFHGEKVFNNPKSTQLIKYLINLHPKKDIIVLDFFAGSGTTGQAVLELNLEDNGKRQFILCTNNEVNDDTAKKYLLDKYPNLLLPKNKKLSKSNIIEILKQSNFSFDENEYEEFGICKAVTYKRLKFVKDKYNLKDFSLSYYKVLFEQIEKPLPKTNTDLFNLTTFQEQYSKVIDGLIRIKESRTISILKYQTSSIRFFESINNNIIIINESIYKDCNELSILSNNLMNKKENIVYFFCPSNKGFEDNHDNEIEFSKTIKAYINVSNKNIHPIPKKYLEAIINKGDFQI